MQLVAANTCLHVHARNHTTIDWQAKSGSNTADPDGAYLFHDLAPVCPTCPFVIPRDPRVAKQDIAKWRNKLDSYFLEGVPLAYDKGTGGTTFFDIKAGMYHPPYWHHITTE